MINTIRNIRINTDDILRREIVENRLKNGANALILISGETNSGKSYSAISICSTVTKMYSEDIGTEINFSSRDIVYDGISFIRRFRELQALPSRGRGSFLVWDEAGTSLSSRGSQTIGNQTITELFEMVRSSLISCVFTVPQVSFVDLRIRKLLHMILIAQPITRNKCENWKKNLSSCRFYKVIHANNPGEKEGEFKTACPVVPVLIKNHIGEKFIKMVRVPQIWIKKADEKLLREYEKSKQIYFDSCMAKAERRLVRAEAKISSMDSSNQNTERNDQPVVSQSPPIMHGVEQSAMNSLLGTSRRSGL